MTRLWSTRGPLFAVAALVSLLLTLPESTAASIDQELRALIDEHGLTGEPKRANAALDPAAPLPSLGRALFFSKQLSGDRDVACASCHHPLLGGSDGLSLAVGIGSHRPEVVGLGRLVDISADRDPKATMTGGPNVSRHSITTFNAALFARSMLWDGRVSLIGEKDGTPLYRTPESTLRGSPDVEAHGDLLAVQARFPVVSFQEMRGFGEFYSLTAAEVRTRIAQRLREHEGWIAAFRQAFRQPKATAEEIITFDNIAAALSAFQRSQIFVRSPWRDYVRGDESALDPMEKEGARLFFSSPAEGGFGCASCHQGDFFTDESFHVAAFPQLGRGKRADGDDPGLYLVTQEKKDLYKFRTPSLLNVAATGPWGHSGAFGSLESLIRFHIEPRKGVESYDFSLEELPQLSQHGGAYENTRLLTERSLNNVDRIMQGQRSPSDQETEQLVAFLNALTDPCVVSRECMQPWMANYLDDFDGQLLQPVFEAATGPVRFHIESTPVAVNDERSDALPSAAPPVSLETVERLTACHSRVPRRPATGSYRFIDRTKELGLRHEHFIPGEMWYGSRYAFTVEFAMHSGPMSSGDLNGDCLPDLLFGTHSGVASQAIAYLNTGDSFVSKELELPEMPDAIGSFGLADLDGDYRLDLAIGNLFGARETVIYRSLGSAEYELAQKISMSKVVFGFAFGDVTGDGWLDVFAAHWDIEARPAKAPALMVNRGGGLLLPADREAGTTGADLEQNFHFSPGFVDLDDDGDVDLLIASDFETSEVLSNDGGRFEVVTDRSVIDDENGMGSVIADFDNDGVLDWFVTSIYRIEKDTPFEWGETGNRLYRGVKGKAAFENVTAESGIADGAWAWGACAADFNNDGWLDIFHENGFGSIPEHVRGRIPGYIFDYLPTRLETFHRDRPRLFINNGDGTFDESGIEWGLTAETNGRGVVCIDFDRDGDIDVATSQNSGPPRVYENQARGLPDDSFVGFHLIGVQPNTSAVGAVVTIQAGDSRQVRHVQLNSNFQGQNPSTLHFGVGGSEQIDSVEVRWPDGRIDNLTEIPANQYYPVLHPLIREQKSLASAD